MGSPHRRRKEAARDDIPRELRSVYDLAIGQDWRVFYAGSGHLRWLNPDGVRIVNVAHTPSRGHRALQNTIARLRAGGLDIPRRT